MQLASDIRPANPTIGFGLTPQNTATPASSARTATPQSRGS